MLAGNQVIGKIIPNNSAKARVQKCNSARAQLLETTWPRCGTLGSESCTGGLTYRMGINGLGGQGCFIDTARVTNSTLKFTKRGKICYCCHHFVFLSYLVTRFCMVNTQLTVQADPDAIPFSARIAAGMPPTSHSTLGRLAHLPQLSARSCCEALTIRP